MLSMIFKNNKVLVNKNDYSKIPANVEEDTEYVPLIALIPHLTDSEMKRLLINYQEYKWDFRTKYCGVCGCKTKLDKTEGCKFCEKCGEKFFHSLFPAVIVSIIKDDKILLAHNTGFPNGMYSVLAGFVDPGENLEEAVKREVMEEVGIKVKNIKYYGSQNWGFTSSLMIAFTAEYKSGKIEIDNKEIDCADWFSKNELPELPPKKSIGRILIEDFIEKI